LSVTRISRTVADLGNHAKTKLWGNHISTSTRAEGFVERELYTVLRTIVKGERSNGIPPRAVQKCSQQGLGHQQSWQAQLTELSDVKNFGGCIVAKNRSQQVAEYLPTLWFSKTKTRKVHSGHHLPRDKTHPWWAKAY
jgi:hypothetical protein